MSNLKCIDKQIEFQGDYHSSVASVLTLTFESCNNETRSTCKSEEELKEWLSNKDMVLAYNKKILNSNKFYENTFSDTLGLDFNKIKRHPTNSVFII